MESDVREIIAEGKTTLEKEGADVKGKRRREEEEEEGRSIYEDQLSDGKGAK